MTGEAAAAATKPRASRPVVRIRPFAMPDYVGVVDLWLKAGLQLRAGDSPSEIESKLGRDPDLFLVATASAERADGPSAGPVVVGSAIGGWDGRRGSVYHLAVHPDYQRCGIGRSLLREVERRLAARGCRRVDLLVRASNTEAHAFYTRLGYEASPELVLMGKNL